MALKTNRRGISSEVLKIAAAMLIALAVFSLLATFALGPKRADAVSEEAGHGLLNFTQGNAVRIINYE